MRQLVGIGLVVVSGMAYGAMPVFAHYAYASGVTPTTLLFLRFSIAAVVLLAVLALRGVPLPRGRTLLVFVLLGALGFGGISFSYFTALTLIPAGLVALLLYIYPALVTLLAALLLKEKLTRVRLLALGLAVGGSILTIGEVSGAVNPLGIVFAIAAALIYSGYILATDHFSAETSALQSTTVVICGAALVYTVAVLLQGPALPGTAAGWAGAVALALLSTVLAIGGFFAGMARIGPTNAALISTVEPVTALLLAALLLEEPLTPLRLLGGGLIITAVLLLTRRTLQTA